MNQERIAFIKNVAIEAGQLTLEGFGKCGRMPKDGPDGYDIATEYDLRTEDLVKKRILETFGEPVLGEEAGLIGDIETAKHRLWIVDPIDGTFNYQRGLPLYGVSIAYCEERIPVSGAIFLPALGQLFFASKGSGSFLSQDGIDTPTPIQVSQEREWSRLVISLAGKDMYRLLAACAAKGMPWRSLRLCLCAVSSIVHVASGRMDVFSDVRLNLWDCAAGDILLREAGGPPVFDYQGTPIFPEYLNRRLDLGDANKFSCLAMSSLELFQEPLRSLISFPEPQV